MKIFLFVNIRLYVFSKRKTVFRVFIIGSVSSFAQCVLVHLLEDAVSSSFKWVTRTFLSSLFKTRLGFVLSVNRWSLPRFRGFCRFQSLFRFCGCQSDWNLSGADQPSMTPPKGCYWQASENTLAQHFSEVSLFRAESFLTVRELVFRFICEVCWEPVILWGCRF